MKIAIDLRSLSSGTVSGVENYCLNLLEHMLPMDRKNQYTLFYNGWKRKTLGDFHFINSRATHSGYPNKIVNLALKLQLLSLERLAGEFDCLFMPNLNQFNYKTKAKIVLTVHDLSPVITPEFYNFKRRLWHKFLNYKKSFERADVLLAVSQHTKNDLVRVFGINPEKIKVTYPGINHKVFKPNITTDELRLARNVYGLPGEFILFLNTIEPRKNLGGLIKAFEQLDTTANLVIAGRLGWKWKKDFQSIKKSTKSAKIKYIGYVEEKHKPAVIKLASALIYPSFYEGFGFQPLEAMALGTPVITSQLTSVPEVVENCGLIINPYDTKSLVEGLNQILNNTPLKEQLVKKAFLQANKFSWEATASKTLEVLNNL